MSKVLIWRKLVAAGLLVGMLNSFSYAQSGVKATESGTQSQPDKFKVSKEVFDLLRNRCHQCHGEQSQYENLDVLDRKSLLDGKFVTPGKPEDSAILAAISDNRMPKGASTEPESRNRPLSLEEKNLVKLWIEQGAEFPSRSRFDKVKFVSRKTVMESVHDFLKKQPSDRRHFFKFFSLANVYNNPAYIDEDVAIRRAALSKILNSISRSSQIVLPKPLPGTEETVYVINWKDDLRLDLDLWRSVLQRYPFGLKLNTGDDPDIRLVYDNIEGLIDVETERFGIYVVRADWFVATACRPPLYHTLAGIPQEFSGIEKELNLSVSDNFRNDSCRRIAIQRSGVSKQNRVLEWHEAKSRKGTLWVSYDFGRNVGKATIEIRPLGPKKIAEAAGANFEKFAFEHSGGEMIYPRSNGLHGYMLTDAEGKRIDAGPIDIVSDPSESSGTAQIVNGISCMHCHRHGMLSKYEASPDTAVIGNVVAQKKVERIYATEAESREQFDEDRRNYLDALSKAIAPFLVPNYDSIKTDREKQVKAIERFEDPISVVARQYRADLGIRQVALELEVELEQETDINELAAKLDDSTLKKVGIGPLVKKNGLLDKKNGRQGKYRSGVIKRDLWDDREVDGESLYQTVARKLQIGTPINNLKPGN